MMDQKVIWILICTLISNSAYALIAPFLPLEFKAKGISGEMIGLIFAIYSVAVIVCSPLVCKSVHYVGNTNMISIGIATMGVSFVFFSTIQGLDKTSTVLVVSFILRFVQGASSAFVQTTCYSMATNDFPEDKEKIVGWVEALTGLGLILGPIIGSMLYSALGFQNTFIVYGCFLIFLSLVIKMKFQGGSTQQVDTELDDDYQVPVSQGDFSSLPDDSITADRSLVRAQNDQQIPDSKKVSLCSLLSHMRFTMAALSSSLCYFATAYMEPILAERLVDFDLTTMQIGFFFAIWPVFYIPSSIAVQYFSYKVDKRVTIILSAIASSIAFILVGPSQIFNLPNSLIIMGMGQALVGVFMAFMMIPGLPEMVESTLPHYPGQEREVNDLSSGIYNAFLGLGQVIAPTYGSFVTEAVGFRMTADIVSMICFFFAISYFILAGGREAFVKTCKAKRSKKSSRTSKRSCDSSVLQGYNDNNFVRLDNSGVTIQNCQPLREKSEVDSKNDINPRANNRIDPELADDQGPTFVATFSTFQNLAAEKQYRDSTEDDSSTSSLDEKKTPMGRRRLYSDVFAGLDSKVNLSSTDIGPQSPFIRPRKTSFYNWR